MSNFYGGPSYRFWSISCCSRITTALASPASWLRLTWTVRPLAAAHAEAVPVRAKNGAPLSRRSTASSGRAKPPSPVPAAFKEGFFGRKIGGGALGAVLAVQGVQLVLLLRENTWFTKLCRVRLFFPCGLRHTGRCRCRISYVQHVVGLARRGGVGAARRGIAENTIADTGVLFRRQRPHLVSRALPSGISKVSLARLIQQEPRPMAEAASNRLPPTRLASCTPLGLVLSQRTSTAVGAP